MNVYVVTHRASGKKYFGYTKFDIQHRWKKHMFDAQNGSNYYFHRALRKHGPDAFDWELFESYSTEAEAKLAEMWCIAGFGTKALKGYNCTDGGDGWTGNHSFATKKLISSRCVGKNLGDKNPSKRPEVRAKISASMKGKKTSLGQKRSEETKKTMSEAARKRGRDRFQNYLQGDWTPSQATIYRWKRKGWL